QRIDGELQLRFRPAILRCDDINLDEVRSQRNSVARYFQQGTLPCDRHAVSFRRNSVMTGILKPQPLVDIMLIDDILRAQRPHSRRSAADESLNLVYIIPQRIDHVIRWLCKEPCRRSVIVSYRWKAIVQFVLVLASGSEVKFHGYGFSHAKHLPSIL